MTKAATKVKCHTTGYGGDTPSGFIAKFKQRGVGLVIDVRLRPDRACMTAFKRTKSPDQGIEKLLREGGISYLSVVELGNVFMDYDDWSARYQELIERAGDLLLRKVLELSVPFCLLCSEKDPSQCHRKHIADKLIALGYEVVHIV